MAGDGPVVVDDPLRGGRFAAHEGFLHLLEAFVGLLHVPGAQRGEVDLGGQQLPQIGLVRLERHRRRQLGRAHLLRVTAVEPLEQLGGQAQVLQLHVQVQLPDRLHLRIRLGLHERVVQVALVVLVVEQHLPPALARVDQRLVVGDVLLLDHPDLLVELPGDRLHGGRADVHVEVHRLLLGRHDRQGVQFGDRRRAGAVVGLAHVVDGVAMMQVRRPARHHLGHPVDDLLRLAVLDHLVQVGVAVEMVEVLQHAELVGLLEVGVRLHPRHPRGQVDRHLLVGDRGLQHRGHSGQQPVDHLLLLRLDVAHPGQLLLDLRVRAVAGQVVAEHDRLHLDPVHRDDPAPGVGIGVVGIDRDDVQLTPVAQLLVQRDAPLPQRVEGHVHALLRARPECRGPPAYPRLPGATSGRPRRKLRIR